MKRTIFMLAASALLVGVGQVHAGPIATIDGAYDKSVYDTPELTFYNTTGANLDVPYTFTSVVLTLSGYQGTNNGVTQSRSLPNMGPGTSNYVWLDGYGGVVPGDLFSYDYDDTNGVTASGQPGNFIVTFTAVLSGPGAYNGQSIYSQFSPTNNATGQFIGWEGLDENGYAESVWDAHNGTPGGTLAYIYIGTPPSPNAPEPASMTLLGIGIAGLGGYGWRRRKQAAAA